MFYAFSHVFGICDGNINKFFFYDVGIPRVFDLIGLILGCCPLNPHKHTRENLGWILNTRREE